MERSCDELGRRVIVPVLLDLQLPSSNTFVLHSRTLSGVGIEMLSMFLSHLQDVNAS